MAHTESIKAAIVDYGLGNLFSVKHACVHAGMEASIVSPHREIMKADVVILPGVGAFGYGEHEFCSSLQYKNVFACQFHPERSGLNGLYIYHNIAALARDHNIYS